MRVGDPKGGKVALHVVKTSLHHQVRKDSAGVRLTIQYPSEER